MARALKLFAFFIAGYAVLALVLGGLIAYFQPQRDGTLVLRTFDQSEQVRETVLREIILEEERYLWSAKWFRGWYQSALSNPDVEIIVDGNPSKWRTIEVTDEATIEWVVGSQRDGVNPAAWWFGRSTVLFAPIKILKLEPR